MTSGKSGLIVVVLRSDDDGSYEIESCKGERLESKPLDRWRFERDLESDSGFHPCDGHPADVCETCKGACSCHLFDSDAEWFEREWVDSGEDVFERALISEALLNCLKDRVDRRVRVSGRMWWSEHNTMEGHDYDGGFEVESWVVLPSLDETEPEHENTNSR